MSICYATNLNHKKAFQKSAVRSKKKSILKQTKSIQKQIDNDK